MKKKLSIEQIEKSVGAVPEVAKVSEATPLKFSKKDKTKKKRKHLKLYIFLSIFGIILCTLGFFGYRVYKSMSGVFGENAPGLLSLLGTKQLKGESSGRVNILLLGVGDPGHAGEQLSDTIMVISYDVASKQVSMISVPRDLYVKINDTCGTNKINYAHACGEQNKSLGGGPAVAMSTISKVLDIPIHYYVRVNFTGFKDVVDAVGGVDINVEKDLYDPYYPADDGLGNKALNIKAGMQHMNGATALRYARSRETTSDFDRARRQQQVLVAIKGKLMSTDTFLNPSKIISISTALGNNVKTDFDLSYAQRAIDLFKKVDTGSIKNLVFDNSEKGLLTDSTSDYAGYILVPRAGMFNYTKMQAAAKNIFADQTVATENAKLTVQNGTTTGGLATRVADKLRGLDFNVVTVASADTQAYTVTKIIDGTNGGKPGTIKALEKTFNVKSEKGTNPSGTDIIVIVGKDYKE
jgi:LCP family protein required for cell wall assembly